MALLQVLKGDSAGQQLVLDGERMVLGRHPDCDIVLDAAAVSRQHAIIFREDDRYFVEDLHSRNGTFVNGHMIEGRRALEDGDRLKICDLAFTFLRDPSEQRVPSLQTLDGDSIAMVDDQLGKSTIMTQLEMSSSRSPMRLLGNPEAKLRAMIEIAHNLGRAISVEAVLPKLLDSIFKIFPQADHGFIIFQSAPGAALVPKAIKHRHDEHEDAIRISRTIVEQVMRGKQAILSADAAHDQRFEKSESVADLRIRSVMCAPLIDSEGEPLGVLQIDTLDQRHRFQKEDLDVLASIASQAAIAVDNAQLHEQALRQQAIASDLQLAHKVQRGLLPAAPPKIEGYRFFDFYEPANQVGGDYYDYVDLPGGRLAIILGDVSGKGVSAALLMAKLSGEVRYCLVSEPTPAAAMNCINDSFSRSGWDDRFVTFVLAVLDASRHEVTIVNAGHMPPLLRRHDGKVESIGSQEAGLPLGVDMQQEYQQTLCTLAAGDFMTMFTDGISEAMNAEGELYGVARLREQVGAAAGNVSILGRQILDDVKRFVGGRPQSDDMCLACFGRTDES